VQSEIEAVKEARKIGFPIVMKIVSDDIPHKSDVGGVITNVISKDQVTSAYKNIIRQISNNIPKARINGVLLSKQEPKGTEVVVGMIRDPQFGPTMMFGLGGLFVEILKDVSFRICPVDRIDVEEMINEIKGKQVLLGYRGKPKLDIDSIADIIINVSNLTIENPNIMEIDLNPIIVYEKGAVVVDAKLFVNEK